MHVFIIFKTISSAINSRYTAVYISASSIYFISLEQDQNIHNSLILIYFEFCFLLFQHFQSLYWFNVQHHWWRQYSCKCYWVTTTTWLFYSEYLQNHLWGFADNFPYQLPCFQNNYRRNHFRINYSFISLLSWSQSIYPKRKSFY